MGRSCGQQIRGVNPLTAIVSRRGSRSLALGDPLCHFHIRGITKSDQGFSRPFTGIRKGTGSGKHNRFIYIAGMSPVLLDARASRIKAGGWPRPATSQASSTGIPVHCGNRPRNRVDSLLYSNGSVWVDRKRCRSIHFSKSNCFTGKVHGFGANFRKTVAERLEALRAANWPGQQVIRIGTRIRD